ncbi:MAG: outer membrane protein assembly factor BamC [Gammaproteobacteria bacterium]|nr:outer membrane protein assembly factor BamC [Gammaproteobacteria bacterium]
MPFVFYKRISSPVLRGLFLLMIVSTLNACSWFAGDDGQTGDARLLAPLEIPPDLVTPRGDPRLARPVLPELGRSSAKPVAQTVDCQCNESPRIGERVLPAGKGVQRMREGLRRWLVVEAEPEQAWPLVRKFLDMRGYRIQRDEPAIGLLETDWKAQYSDEQPAGNAQANWRESLRIRIEPAEKPGYTDIFLTQRNSQRVAGEDEQTSRWELRPADDGRAVEMLNRLARYLAAENVSDAVPLQPLDARIDVDSEQSTAIIVKAGFDVVWRRTGLALDALGFTIEDFDRSSRIYHVYNDLPSGLSEEELNYGKKKSATVREEYWIHVQEKGDFTHISVRNQVGDVDESQVTRSLLVLLLGQLK